MAGEEPLLGSLLGAGYIQGMQSNGVVAVAKHFVANSQETNRPSLNSIITSRALHEVYYPSFRAAVKAGVGSIMCGYNLVNGKHACGDSEVLRDLKRHMGFHGWVMSDWWVSGRITPPHTAHSSLT